MRSILNNINLDLIGFGASFLCAIHCALLPFVISILPIAGLEFLENEWVEYSIIILSFILASTALTHGYTSHHRSFTPLIIVVSGFLSICLGHSIFEEGNYFETVLTVMGALIIAVAHVVNWNLVRKHSQSHTF